MSSVLRRKRLLLTAVALCAVGAGVFLLRPWLGGYVIRTALGLAGATEIRFRPVTTGPTRVVVEDLEFRIKGQVFAARRLTLERPRWWRMTLGRVQVEGARAALTVDGSDTNPWHWNTFEAEAEPAEPMGLPVEALVLEGVVTVRAALQPDRQLTVKLEGAPRGKSDWVGSLVVNGPGFKLAGVGTLLGWGTELDFQVQRAELDLNAWQGFIQRNLLLPGGPWEMGGRLTGVAEGRVTARRFAATARVSLREGRMRARTQDISAEGVEAELEFSDLWKLRTQSGVLRAQELRLGRLPLTEVEAAFGLWGGPALSIARASFAALGGRVEVAPFKYFLHQAEVTTRLEVSEIDLARLKKIMPEVTVALTGRVSGSLPLRVQETGVRFDAGGHLALSPGGAAQWEGEASALVRSGAHLTEGSLEVLKTAGTGPVRLQLSALRLDIRPPDLPLGCSARLHVAGATSGGAVEFSFDVNGAVEKYLDILTVRR